MARRKPSARQTTLPEVDTRERRVPDIQRIDLTGFEVGAFVGVYKAKNLRVNICDRCHRPGVKLGERWYHRMPCTSPCTLSNAPYPAPAALSRLREWYLWAQGVARDSSPHTLERAKKLEEVVYPMTPYLLSLIAVRDRRHLPTVTECRMIREAMASTENDSWMTPVEIEDWTATIKSTS